ncbi:MAG: hypothetical protein HDR37_03835 [Treponema sp.]|nr:hypothetical protein [Treponema sp.]
MPMKKSWNAVACYVDGRKYDSLFAAAIDYEIDYSWLVLKLKKSGGSSVKIRGHVIELCEKRPAGGIIRQGETK